VSPPRVYQIRQPISEVRMTDTGEGSKVGERAAERATITKLVLDVLNPTSLA